MLWIICRVLKKKKAKKIWKDPVWSGVIAAVIVGIGGYIIKTTTAPNKVVKLQSSEDNKIPTTISRHAVNKLFITLLAEDQGLIGVKNEVEECYENIYIDSSLDNIKFCFSLDYSGYLLDHTISPHLTFPADAFLTRDNSIKRAKEAFSTTNISTARWENFLFNAWMPEVEIEFREGAERSLSQE